MTLRRNVTAQLSAALVTGVLLITGCTRNGERADGGKPAPAAGAESPVPHGYVEGAEETAEPQPRLLLNDPGSGGSRVLDLVTGAVTETAAVKDTVRIGADGRFGYFHGPGGTRVLDGGSWTVDHGDHAHHYRADIRGVGLIPGREDTRVRGDAAVTAVTDGNGRAALYDRPGLEKGRLGTPRALPGTFRGAVVPYAGHLVTLTGEGGTARLAVLDRKGQRVAAPDAECREPGGDAVTRRGAVLNCADGALLVREKDGAFSVERIPYKGTVPERERAGEFRYRPGGDTLTALAESGAVWVLDVTERTWTRVETGPVLAVNTAGEGSPLLALAPDGTLHGWDTGTGKRVARTKALLTGRLPADRAPVIEVDRSRAYVNDPRGRRVLEIDYNDGLRVARAFALDIEPELMAETGR
ncbi:hypothetical protein ABZ714_30195 [Streptomyces sp. NPDC006798]|uniref:hypothetical protein n=1 Tax=Streptomyces sp. NPDC006798 TaxID=3155462 RepID=UPI0033DE1076